MRWTTVGVAMAGAGCLNGPPEDACYPCRNAQSHMIENVAANDCNPNFMQEAVDRIVEECDDVEDEDGDDLELDPFRLIGAIHETCQAGGLPSPRCDAGPTASLQVELSVDPAVQKAYPEGFEVTVSHTGSERVVPLLDGAPTRLDRALVGFEYEPVEVAFAEALATEAPPLASGSEDFVIRQSAAAFDRPLRSVTLGESTDGVLLLRFEHW